MMPADEPSNKVCQLKYCLNAVQITVLLLLVMDTLHVRYAINEVEQRFSSQLDQIKQKQYSMQFKLDILEAKHGKTQFGNFELKMRKRRHINVKETRALQVIDSIIADVFQRKKRGGYHDCNSTIFCVQGQKGERGKRGKSWPRGIKGPMGVTGGIGPQGVIGPAGTKGNKGDKGDRGLPGKSIERPRINTKLHPLVIPESNNISLFCEATGNPKPSLKWEFPLSKPDERYSFPIEGGLSIINIKKEDSGELRCVAENILGKDTIKTFLDVQVKPVIDLPAKSLITNAGISMEVVCNATGKPKPKITWSKSHGTLRGEQVLSNEGKSLKLKLDKPDIMDSGFYFCSAENIIGSVTKSIFIQVTVMKKNCAELRRSGFQKSGVYRIEPDDGPSFNVYCDMTTDDQGWTLLQRRMDGSQDFYLTWDQYKRGFGGLEREFWLGNDKIHRLTKESKMMIRFDLEDTQGNKKYAEYDSFSIGAEATKYLAHVGKYKGTAGNSFGVAGHRFSTKDKDNDVWSGQCAVSYHGAWWYAGCHRSNLNGKYLNGQHKSEANGVNWRAWKGYNYSLKKTEIKIRPKIV